MARNLVGALMSAASGDAVVLRDITLAYNGRPAVCHVSGSFARGSLTAIVGPNGSGKSTLLKGIVGLLRPTEGFIAYPQSASSGIAYLPQHIEIDRRFPISVIDTVLLGLWRRIGWARPVSGRLRQAARQAIATVWLEGLEQRPVETLSAGQFQRVLFARLIVQDADLILLDEPFSAIDWRTSDDLLRLIANWHQAGRTVPAVLHDLDQIRAYFPNSLLLARKCIAWGATREVLSPHNLRRAREMSGSWPAEPANDEPIPPRAYLPVSQ